MAYLKGDNYVFGDIDGFVHIWVRGGFEDVSDSGSGWGEGEEDGGISISQDAIDSYVVMRCAELAYNREFRSKIEDLCARPYGNFGEGALRKNAKLMIALAEHLEGRFERVDGVDKL